MTHSISACHRTNINEYFIMCERNSNQSNSPLETRLERKMKKYRLIGSNLEMDMLENNYRLKIVGDNNHIKIQKNFGSVIIIGDNCYVDVQQNFGELQTTSGNNIVIVNAFNLDKDVLNYYVDKQSDARKLKEDTTVLKKPKKVKKMALSSLVKDVLSGLKINFA